MSLRGLLRHPVAIITPATADIDTLDDAGFPEPATPIVRLVPAMIQPRDAHEQNDPLGAGTEMTDFLIFLEMMPLSIGAYITDADDSGPIAGGRRFQVNGIQPFAYGRDPHLEVYATLVGNTDYNVGS